MKVTNEKTENRQAFLTIEMEPTEVATAMEAAYRKTVKKVNIPGFRRGKAPRPIFERHFGTHELFHEMLDDLVPEAYRKAIEEQKIAPVAQAQIEVVEEHPLIIKAVVPLQPVITLGDYHTIDLKPQPKEVTDEMVDKVVDRLLHQYATWEPVEREVTFNDLTTINIKSTLDGKTFLDRDGVQYPITKDSKAPAPGFAEQLVGMKKGEEKEFTIQFPVDSTDKEIAGKEVTFKVKVIEIKQEKMPELSDGFAAEVSPECTTVEILRQKIMDDLKKRADEQSQQEFEGSVIAAAAAMSQVEFPPVMVESEIDRLIEREFRFLEQTGQNMEQYLQSVGRTVEQEREELRPAAQKRVGQFLVLGSISQAEKLEASETEIDTEIEDMIKNSTENKEVLQKVLAMPRGRESVADTLITRKVIQRITEIAQSPKEKKEETK